MKCTILRRWIRYNYILLNWMCSLISMSSIFMHSSMLSIRVYRGGIYHERFLNKIRFRNYSYRFHQFQIYMAYPNMNWGLRSMPQYLIVYYFSNHKVIFNSDCIDRNNSYKYFKKYRFCIQLGTINIQGYFQTYPRRNLNGKHPHQQNCQVGNNIFHFECLIRIHCNIVSM